ncbi:MAG TPA: histidine kinase [Dyadobacter sp.]|nr:histidine kinase [Dyadobacter sp.]
MQQTLPVKHLIRQSGRMMLLLLVASLIIGNNNTDNVAESIFRALISLGLFTAVFFSNIAILIFYHNKQDSGKRLLDRKTFITGYLCTIVFVTICYIIESFLRSRGILTTNSLNDPWRNLSGWRVYAYLPYVSLMLYLFIFLIQSFVLSQYEKSRIELELLKLKSVNTDTVNQLLRQQIQPHFLFNALNVLRSLIKKYPQTADAYLIRLSDFLRASITRNSSGLATIREELKLCDDYMEMQRIRFGTALDYQVMPEVAKVDEAKFLPFFSLQPLLENAIKHNELTTLHPLTITISRQENCLVVRNNFRPKKMMEASSGSGLANLRERYKILSGDNIVIKTDESFFSVSIKILDHEYNHH